MRRRVARRGESIELFTTCTCRGVLLGFFFSSGRPSLYTTRTDDDPLHTRSSLCTVRIDLCPLRLRSLHFASGSGREKEGTLVHSSPSPNCLIK